MPEAAGISLSDAKPLIRVQPGKIDVLTDQAENALILAEADVFQRADHVVRPGYLEVSAADGRTTIAAGLYVLNEAALIDELTRVADWEHWDGRSKKWVAINSPSLV